jgi:tRNA pseudouridine55 synthase
LTIKIKPKSIEKNSLNGWLVVNKPAGITSNTVIQKIKRHINPKKIGHAGTLDPDATGVLPVALGEATKTVPYLMRQEKSYEAVVKFGIKTDTDDISGKTIMASHYRPTEKEVTEALLFFTGQIYQKPPNVSAVKVNGKRAYKLFHSGHNFSLASRKLRVSSLEIMSFLDKGNVRISFSCSKGGYVRSIARDIGDFLGCFGCIEELSRTNYGPFLIDKSTDLEKLLTKSYQEVEKLILGIELSLYELIAIQCNYADFQKLNNGIPIINSYNSAVVSGEELVAFYQGKPLCILICKDYTLKPKRKFNLF